MCVPFFLGIDQDSTFILKMKQTGIETIFCPTMNRGQTLQMSRLQCCGDGREIAEMGATGACL